MKRNLVSRHGIVLHTVCGDTSVIDGVAMYVDDLVDCAESFSGGSFKAHCVEMFQRELKMAEDLHSRIPTPSTANMVSLRRHLLSLVDGETEGPLCKFKEALTTNKHEAIQRAMRAAGANVYVVESL